MSKVDKFEKLKDLILGEQLLASVSKDLAVFIRERAHTTLDEMIQSADNYRKAHPEKMIARKDDRSIGNLHSDGAAAMASFQPKSSTRWSSTSELPRSKL